MPVIDLIFISPLQFVEEKKKEAVYLATDLESPDSPKLDEEEATPIEVEEVQPGTPEEQSLQKL